MKSEEKWDFQENILQTYARTQKLASQAVTAAVVHAALLHRKLQAQMLI